MKLSRLVALLAGLALGLSAAPAQAAEGGLSLEVAQRWDAAAQPGFWTPYTVSVRNSGPSDFTGDVLLLPNQTPSRGAPQAQNWPVYRVHVTVPKDGDRTLTVFVIEAAGGYGAELRDAAGRPVVEAQVQAANRAPLAAALLSDVQQGDQKITALRPLPRGYDFSMTRFQAAPAFPTNAVYLSGLSAIVIDQFDTASLSQAQVQALRDFVGLGGSLVLAGGSSWRRTLLPLPAELTPMRPQASGVAAIGALTQLAGRASDLAAPIVSGALQSGRVVVAAPDGSPLIVEGAYGAGKIVELALDPFADPLDGQPSLATIVWSQAMARALLDSGPGSRLPVNGGFGPSGGGPGATGGVVSAGSPGGFAPGYAATGAEVLGNLLTNTAEAALPPVGLLGGLLVAYILLAGIANYMFLKSLRRREMMWLTVPLVALLFTGASYWVGAASRGSDFFDNEVQIQRLAPDGTVETYSFHGIYAPHRGDYEISIPANTLASTAIGYQNFNSSTESAEIEVGARQTIQLRGVAIWSLKTVQTLSVSHGSGLSPAAGDALEAHLALKGGRLQGTVLNKSGRPIQSLRAVTASGRQAQLVAGELGVGQTATIDASLDSGAPQPAGPGSSAPTIVCSGGTSSTSSCYAVGGGNGDKRETVLQLAGAEGTLASRSGIALVGLSQGAPEIQVDGGLPAHSTLAAVVEPVSLDSVDSLNALAIRPRLVSMVGDNNYTIDTYDIVLPPGASTSGLAVSYFFPPAATTRGAGTSSAQAPVQSVDIYDWTTGSWRSLPQLAAVARGASVPVNAGESQGGIVRVRVAEETPLSAQLGVSGQ